MYIYKLPDKIKFLFVFVCYFILEVFPVHDIPVFKLTLSSRGVTAYFKEGGGDTGGIDLSYHFQERLTFLGCHQKCVCVGGGGRSCESIKLFMPRV